MKTPHWEEDEEERGRWSGGTKPRSEETRGGRHVGGRRIGRCNQLVLLPLLFCHFSSHFLAFRLFSCTPCLSSSLSCNVTSSPPLWFPLRAPRLLSYTCLFFHPSSLLVSSFPFSSSLIFPQLVPSPLIPSDPRFLLLSFHLLLSLLTSPEVSSLLLFSFFSFHFSSSSRLMISCHQPLSFLVLLLSSPHFICFCHLLLNGFLPHVFLLFLILIPPLISSCSLYFNFLILSHLIYIPSVFSRLSSCSGPMCWPVTGGVC